jgi:hypothetical protein
MEKTTGPHQDSGLPLIGAQVFIEPGQTPAEIANWFRIMRENQLSISRIRMFENYIRIPAGGWDFSLFDRTTTDAICEQHANWLAALAALDEHGVSA